MSEDAMVPVGEVLNGMQLLSLGAGVTVLDAVVLVKAIDEDGRVGWYTRYTQDVTTVETIGALHAALVLEEDHLRRIYMPARDDEDDDA